VSLPLYTAMSDADVERVKSIATKYRWRGPDGVERPFLSDDEVAQVIEACNGWRDA
jgi:hypothetical protein